LSKISEQYDISLLQKAVLAVFIFLAFSEQAQNNFPVCSHERGNKWESTGYFPLKITPQSIPNATRNSQNYSK